MPSKFEPGKTYRWYAGEYDPITVLKRTEKTITVRRLWSDITWRMLIHHDAEGNEIVTDSYMPRRYRDCFTCSAKGEVEIEED